jgi:hypothetical protein
MKGGLFDFFFDQSSKDHIQTFLQKYFFCEKDICVQ